MGIFDWFRPRKPQSALLQDLHSAEKNELKQLHRMHDKAYNELQRDGTELKQKRNLLHIIEEAEKDAEELEHLIGELEDLDREVTRLRLQHDRGAIKGHELIGHLTGDLAARYKKIEALKHTALERADRLEKEVEYVRKLAVKLSKEQRVDRRITLSIRKWSQKVNKANKRVRGYLVKSEGSGHQRSPANSEGSGPRGTGRRRTGLNP